MKLMYLLPLLVIGACNDNATEKTTDQAVTVKVDSVVKEPATMPPPPPPAPVDKVYANESFRDVTAVRQEDGRVTVKGKARVFEAVVSWVVEDGHNELKKGFIMTSEGAPGWGDFKFIVDVNDQKPNTTLHLILFESSAKDGSRTHELVIPLR